MNFENSIYYLKYFLITGTNSITLKTLSAPLDRIKLVL